MVRRTDIERLQVVNADGSGGTPILDYPATRPVWSPDGTRIIFHRSGFMGPASHLYVIPSGGAPSPTQESTPITLDFSADWQPIGAVPVITGFPQALVAGAPGATLLVDGRGFAYRSVVRWNGANRPTTWLSPTRLSAQLSAADVAAPGNADRDGVHVAQRRRPLRPGDGEHPAPPPPPPRILLSTSRLSKVKWVASRPRGTLRVAGTLEAAGRVEVALLRGRRVLQRQVFQLPAGAFSRTVKLGKRVLPGKLTLRLQGAGAGSNLVPTTREITLAAPRRGRHGGGVHQRPPARPRREHPARQVADLRHVPLRGAAEGQPPDHHAVDPARPRPPGGRRQAAAEDRDVVHLVVAAACRRASGAASSAPAASSSPSRRSACGSGPGLRA